MLKFSSNANSILSSFPCSQPGIRLISDGHEVLCPQCPMLMDFRESLPEFYLVATSLEIMKTYHVADWESTGREAGLSSARENREGLWSE